MALTKITKDGIGAQAIEKDGIKTGSLIEKTSLPQNGEMGTKSGIKMENFIEKMDLPLNMQMVTNRGI